jgi:NhaP-type Na+/H+ and K+/H+ antiporter
VLLRGLLRNPVAPQAARNALRIESGMNDAVLVPVVLIAMASIGAGTEGGEAGSPWAETAVRVFLLGAGAGVAVGFVAVGALDFVRKRVGIRRDYESLYALGVALAGFAIAEAFHGSGFIAAFAAGITVAALDVELCDCFYDYGEATAEMALIFTFVALGSSAIWSGLAVADSRTLLFAIVALFSRGVILIPTLAWTSLDRRSRLFTIWFGPRGLSSLLLVLLPVFAGMPGSANLFAITSLVVLLSIVIHGGSQMLLRPRRVAPAGPAGLPVITDITGAPVTARVDARTEAVTIDAPIDAPITSPPEEAAPRTMAPAPDTGLLPHDAERITIEEVDELVRRGERVVLLDVRTDTAYESESRRAARAIRARPDDAVRAVRVLGLPPDTYLASYCA